MALPLPLGELINSPPPYDSSPLEGEDNRWGAIKGGEGYKLFSFLMTGETNKPEVVGVSLRTGNADRQAKLEGRGAEYRVDESTGILINVSQQFKKKIQAFDLKR